MNNFKYALFSVPLLIVLWLTPFHAPKANKAEGTELVWLTNLEDAQKISKKTGRPIFANFTGSDWCGWCHKLAREVFNTPEFKEWSDKNVVLLELDFPRNKALDEKLKAQNNSLLQFFQVQGFPTIWVFTMEMDKTTNKYTINPIGKTGYLNGGPKVFTESVDGMITQYKTQQKEKSKEEKTSKKS
ncbi:thioredoxin family protein [Flavobacterium humi]|uniref:Thioredoxin family protein n=1 Tax=Flavobacterium humi TaxID=2562683 RepID=A0A4Z0L881_9FLAO|nr:thioredoxin family protein [Flavobacterium humi]TGD57350.1 thioredoxin family protein [Flavobacterium humi]